MVNELHGALDAIAADRDCRGVVLTGAGRGFCAGLDLKGFGTAPGAEGEETAVERMKGQQHIASLITHMRATPQPIVAAVNGPAAGGGVALRGGPGRRLGPRGAQCELALVEDGLPGCD